MWFRRIECVINRILFSLISFRTVRQCSGISHISDIRVGKQSEHQLSTDQDKY